MTKNLVIVESPAKARTIEKYLGSDYKVTSSMGHIRDLKKGDDAIDIKNDFKPAYEITPDKKDIVKNLKKLVTDAEVVWLATDEDREGEAISWHLYDVLGLEKKDTKRIVFNEITKTAIQKAIAKPRTIDYYLVDAQQARRVLDRLVGFELSPVLWKKVKPSLSAGRVQSVSVRLIVEREREINEFNSSSEFRISALLKTAKGEELKADGAQRFKTAEEAETFLKGFLKGEFKVEGLEVKPSFRNPAPPFTTSTLQQEASRKLGYDVSRTMQLAQRLYENGYISYMRTDSVNLSQDAINAAKDAIVNLFGSEFSNPRNYTTKNESAQEAHEAIRPTDFSRQQAGDDNGQKKLYELIWKRALASQMARAEMERTVVEISGGEQKARFVAEGEIIKFEGFLKVYLEDSDDEDEEAKEGLLPKLAKGDELSLKLMTATQKFSKPAARYTEASLVKKLEELGIGRPSTYAPTITTIQKRGYVVGESRDGKTREIQIFQLKDGKISAEIKKENYGFEKNKLFPTDIGMLVTDFLQANFKNIMDYGFTASVEKEFDEIAKGAKSWQKMMRAFYTPFHELVEKTTESAERVTGERHLGVDPKTGKTVLVRVGRFGPLVQLGTKENDETPQFASLQKSQSIETITLEEALKLFGLPREIMSFEGSPVIGGLGRYGPYLKWNDKYYSVPKGTDLLVITPDETEVILRAALSAPQFPIALGKYEDTELTVNKGRFGPYIKFNDLFVSIPRGEDAANVSLERAIELVKAKQASEAANILQTFEQDKDLQVINGRYGPYIVYKKKNYPIPKGTYNDALSFEAAMEIVKNTSEATEKPKKAAARKPAAKKSATAKKTTSAKKK